MLVRELMTTTPATITENASVKSALVLLAEHRVTCLPVLDADGRAVGVVSEADLVRESVRRDPRLHLRRTQPESEAGHEGERSAGLWSSPVGDVMSTDVVSVHPDDDVVDAVNLFASAFFKALPVLDDQQHVVGMISRSDIVRLAARADQDIHRELVETLASLHLPGWATEVSDGRVEVTGPATEAERTMARVVARSVPGVVEVHIA